MTNFKCTQAALRDTAPKFIKNQGKYSLEELVAENIELRRAIATLTHCAKTTRCELCNSIARNIVKRIRAKS